MTIRDPYVLTNVDTFEDAVRRMPGGTEILDSFVKLGYWQYSGGNETMRKNLSAARSHPLPTDLSGTDGADLTRLHGQVGLLLKWSHDMHGMLQSIRIRQHRKVKRAEASARSSARKNSISGASKRAPSISEVEDLASSDSDAMEAQDALDLIDSLITASKSQIEAYSQYSNVVSRAITLADTEMKLR